MRTSRDQGALDAPTQGAELLSRYGSDAPRPPGLGYRRPGLATTRRAAGHDQLTNPALDAWFGAFEEPPRMSSEIGTLVEGRADDAKQRAAQARDPVIENAYEKVAEYWMLLAQLDSLLGDEKNNEHA